MRRIAAITMVLAALSIGVATAKGEYYGGVSSAYRSKIIRMIHQAFDRYGVGSTMVCIAGRESGYNPRAYNDDWRPYRSVAGLFQIEWRYHATLWERSAGYGVGWWHFYHRMTNPWANIALAVRLYRTSGLSPWGGGC